MYFEFLFFRAHSRKRVERMYWSGWSLNSFTTCSNSVMVGTTGPMGSGFPQFGLPRRFAIFISLSALRDAHFPFVPDSITDRNSPNSLDSLTSQEFLDEIGRVFPRGVSAWPYVTKWS